IVERFLFTPRIIDECRERMICGLISRRSFGNLQLVLSFFAELDISGCRELDRRNGTEDTLLDPRKAGWVEIKMAEAEPNIVGEFVNDRVIVHRGAARRLVLI